MNDTESFEHAMAEMRKVVMDCDMERCDMYDGDCYQCQGDILDRMQRAHERELEHVSKAEYARGYTDGQHSMDAEHYAVALRLRGLRFDGGSHDNLSRIAYAIYPCATGWTCESSEGLRDRLIDLLGGVHEPDAALPTYDVLGNERHKAVCRLRECEFGYTLERDNLNEFFGAFGIDYDSMTMAEAYEMLRDRLIHLLGGDEPTLRELSAELYQAIVGATSMRADQSHESSPMRLENETGITAELREKIHENVNQELYVVVEADDLYAIADNIDAQFDRICQQQEAVLQQTIDEMTEFREHDAEYASTERDHLRRQMDQQRAMLTEQRDEARAKVLRLESENAEWRRGAERDADKLESLTGAYNDAVTENDELRKKMKELEEFDRDTSLAAFGDNNEELRKLLSRSAKLLANAEQDRDANYAYWMDCKEKVVQKSVTIDEMSKELEDARDALNEATGRWAKADEERHELQDRLDAIREAVNAVQ